MPLSPTGSPPTGPGGSPALSPGDGAGRRAAAIHKVKMLLPALLTASMSFEAGSKEQQALIRAVSALNPIFGKAEGENMSPAALQQMMRESIKGPAGSQPPPPGAMMPPGKPPGPSMGPGGPDLGGEA
jgi:hypothetical protein